MNGSGGKFRLYKLNQSLRELSHIFSFTNNDRNNPKTLPSRSVAMNCDACSPAYWFIEEENEPA